jgi:FkbM family methyltransferase
MENLAPIVLFVYNRPLHTQKVVEALLKNDEAKYSNLFVFSDAAKNEEAKEKVEQVRNYIKTISGFKSITIKEQAKNQGLAKSIIDGVTEVVNRFGKIIVLEDDIETSPYFLKFLNDALNFYENEKRVWVITGYNYPINTDKLPKIVFSYFYSCWGWGIWADRWKFFDKNPDKYITLISKKDIYKFDYYGTMEQFSQITKNNTGELNTWAVFLYAEMFVNKGLCLFPAKSLVKNIGFDNSGVHCGESEFLGNNYALEKPVYDFSAIPTKETKLYVKMVRKLFQKQKIRSAMTKCRKRLKKLTLRISNVFKNKSPAVFKCESIKWFGNEYGGFYICRDIIKNDEIIVYSAGVGEDISFDLDIINEYNHCKIFAFDPTPKSIEWIKKQNLPVNYYFSHYGISNKTGEEEMFLPKNKDHVSGSIYESDHLAKEDKIIVQMKCIEDIIKENNHSYIDIIKMDIEGSEFSVLQSLNWDEINCGQIVIEFHERFFKNEKTLINKAIKKLRENNYYCFAVSSTNQEYSFVNKVIYNKGYK